MFSILEMCRDPDNCWNRLRVLDHQKTKKLKKERRLLYLRLEATDAKFSLP